MKLSSANVISLASNRKFVAVLLEKEVIIWQPGGPAHSFWPIISDNLPYTPTQIMLHTDDKGKQYVVLISVDKKEFQVQARNIRVQMHRKTLYQIRAKIFHVDGTFVAMDTAD